MKYKEYIIYLLISSFGLSACHSSTRSYQNGVDSGYRLGTSDAIKRQYWLKQSSEKREAEKSDAARRVYYTFDQATKGEDGRNVVPHKLTLSIVE